MEKEKYKKEITDKEEKIAELEQINEQLNREKLTLHAEKALEQENVEKLKQAQERLKEDLNRETRKNNIATATQQNLNGQLAEKDKIIKELDNDKQRLLDE